MKRLCYFMLYIAVLSSFINAECTINDSNTSYRPFVEDGKSWVVAYSVCHGMMPVFKSELYYIDGDTLVNDQTCKKLMLRVRDYEHGTITTSLDKLIYEQDRKVFYYPVGSTNSVLLYDFAAVPGDTLTLGGTNNTSNSSTQCFQIWSNNEQLEYYGEFFNGQMATIYDPDVNETEVFECDEYPLYHWYQSIGSTHHPFEKTPWNTGWGGMLTILRDCRVGSRVIYTNWKDNPFFPDFTGDGKVDIADVNEAINAMLGKSAAAADVNGDSKVDIADVNAVINAMLGK